jgi:hypothetical protein
MRSVWRINWLGESMWVVFDKGIGEIVAFLPRRCRHVRGYSVEAVSV